MVLQYKINNNNRNMTLDSRLIVYEKINKILTTDLNKNKCIEYDKNLDKLRLNNIVLEKRIGSPSAVGIIMLGNIKKNKLIIKIASKNKENKLEIDIFRKISDKIILKHNIPHFIINYNYFVCEAKNLGNICPKDENYKDLCYYFGSKKYYMCINELADGDLFNIIKNIKKEKIFKKDYLDNIIAQMFLTIYALHYYVKYSHNDTHMGNYLFINNNLDKNSYYHYIVNGKNYYLKNNGITLILTDFGRTTEEPNILKEQQIFRRDYELPITLMKTFHDPFSKIFYDTLNFSTMFEDEKTFIDRNLDKIMETTIKKDDKVINKKSPYIIGK
jgi:hypothetical protein